MTEEKILVMLGVSLLAKHQPLMAYPLFKMAQDKYQDEAAALIIEWLRFQAGLSPGASPERREELRGLDIVEKFENYYGGKDS